MTWPVFPHVGAERVALLLGLSLFFGFAFEEFYVGGAAAPPPEEYAPFRSSRIAGGSLYLLDPSNGAFAFVAGLLVVGSWIYAYVSPANGKWERPQRVHSSCRSAICWPMCLGPLALTQPPWLSVAVAVVCRSSAREEGLVRCTTGQRRVSTQEVITAAQFLILVGVVLPLLAGKPPIPYTTITPFGVWLAVSTISFDILC